MSQYDFGTIDPFVVDGVALASILNNWRDALYSMQRGSTRPAFAVPGQIWCNDSAGPSNWVVNYYVSATIGDKPLFSINTTTGAVTWQSALLGGPFLPLAGGTVTGPTNFHSDLVAGAPLWVDYAAGQPIQYFRAQANPANARVFTASENSDGSFSFRATSDDFTTVQGEAKINRDGSMIVGVPAGTATGSEVVTASWVRALVTAAAAGTPTGLIAPFGGTSAPAGWLLCAGQLVSRTTFAVLFAVIGTLHGAGDGSTTFALPDLRGRAVFGADAMNGIAANRLGGAGGATGGITTATPGASGGEQAHTLSAAEQASMPFSGSANLPANADGATGGGPQAPGYGFIQEFSVPAPVTGTATGGGGKHNVTPPGYVLNYIIKT